MKTLFAFYFSLITVFAFSQTAPGIEWQNTVGGSGGDFLNGLDQTSDGGCIIGGESQSNSSEDKSEDKSGSNDYWVVKLNAAGAIEWDNTIGGSLSDQLKSVRQTQDGGYIVGGVSSSEISGDKTEPNTAGDYWVVKLDASGTVLWDNTIGGNKYDVLNSIEQTADGGYILGGFSNSDISGDKSEPNRGPALTQDYWIVKLDAAGVLEWDKTIGGSDDDIIANIKQTSDGGYIAGGYSSSGISGDKTEASLLGDPDYWLVKLNSFGNVQWQNTIGGTGNDALRYVQQTLDGGYILCGDSDSRMNGDKTEDRLGPGSDYWIVKLDSVGAIEWQNTIGGYLDDVLQSAQQTMDGGYILGGYSESGVSFDKTEHHYSIDYWVVKLDASGIIEWDKTIAGAFDDYFKALRQSSDGGYFLGGESNSGISVDKEENCLGYYDYWVVKLFPEEIPVCTTAPTGLFVDHITTTKAKLHWAADPGALKYKVQYKPATASAWTTVNSTGNIKTLAELIPNTLYKYRVRSTCSDVLSSPWSDIYTFTTLPLKEMSDELSVMNIYPNPNNGNFTIQFPELNDEEISIYIKNMLGEEIYAVQISSRELTHTIRLKENIPAGMYICNIQTKNKIFTQQIIITK